MLQCAHEAGTTSELRAGKLTTDIIYQLNLYILDASFLCDGQMTPRLCSCNGKSSRASFVHHRTDVITHSRLICRCIESLLAY